MERHPYEYLAFGKTDAEMMAAVDEYEAFVAKHPHDELSVCLKETAGIIRAVLRHRRFVGSVVREVAATDGT